MRNRIKQILKEEESDFDWVSSQTPTDKGDIAVALEDLGTIGNYNLNLSSLVDLVHGFGLTEDDADKLASELHDIMYQLHGDAHSYGYDEGFQDGEHEAEGDCRIKILDAEEDGYIMGKEDGEYEGHKIGYKKGYKKGYDVGHEEGIKYLQDQESEEYEDEEGNPYNPEDYDGGY